MKRDHEYHLPRYRPATVKFERHRRASGSSQIYRRYAIAFVVLVVIFYIVHTYRINPSAMFGGTWGHHDEVTEPTIIIITPTNKRVERCADMTRFAQTLSHAKNLHWIVVEDGNVTSPPVQRILERSGIPYVYYAVPTKPGLPKKGWTHRNSALDYVRENYKDYKPGAVVYFADDDNAYDARIFDKYIRKVKRLGVWAVGLSGAAAVEAPKVENMTVVGWHVVWSQKRVFAVDMAGFAVNLKEVLRVQNASFGLQCVKKPPETCFIEQFGIPVKEAEPFGYDEEPKEILAWHVKTTYKDKSAKGSNHGYVNLEQ